MTAARLKASELREKENLTKKLEEDHGHTDVKEEAVPAEAAPSTPPAVGRTPVQRRGSSGSGGSGLVADRLLPVGNGAPLLGVAAVAPGLGQRRQQRQTAYTSRLSTCSM